MIKLKKKIVYDHQYCWIQIYTGETDLIHYAEIKELYFVILFKLLYGATMATQVYTMLIINQVDK